ncbi:unnamed protein product [Peniophora sp. CBMAI 1063]|nr:unnamed protein product [Peniophora sp. CBMAI 1063]
MQPSTLYPPPAPIPPVDLGLDQSEPFVPIPPSPTMCYAPSPLPPMYPSPPTPPSLLAVSYKRTRVLIKWPQTYGDMLEAVRIAFPQITKDDAKIYFETRVSIDTKDYKTKPERARVTPESWIGIQPPWGPSMGITEIDVKTQRKAWNLVKVYQHGRKGVDGVDEKR